jgi:hypothetical protein
MLHGKLKGCCRSHGDTPDNRLLKFQVVEKRREIASQGCNGEVFYRSKVTLSVAAEIGMNDVQGSGRKAGTLWKQEAARLPNVPADAVLKDHRVRRGPWLKITTNVMQTNIVTLIERHTKHPQTGLTVHIDSRRNAMEAGTCSSPKPCKISGNRLPFVAAA